MKKDKSVKFEKIKKEALEHLRSGKWLNYKEGVFASLFKRFQNAAFEAEPEVISTKRNAGKVTVKMARQVKNPRLDEMM